ncbi:hypothetical protein H696_02078 [Fonticula alba]|uniref:BRO1 domain-containing protein n=1 Tax=Fonticula alba TaxID=691883 RepID=A0A058ZCG3_FONAL|nr:hypothetical protein H696_02078 [Fonticula alba]KCV71127.1 hypothetical protein H696_02078 [Fonticula alba]|eukprot:XP_009494250.1 hypothetical protein H696_02078 [Fonticula alba]
MTSPPSGGQSHLLQVGVPNLILVPKKRGEKAPMSNELRKYVKKTYFTQDTVPHPSLLATTIPPPGSVDPLGRPAGAAGTATATATAGKPRYTSMDEVAIDQDILQLESLREHLVLGTAYNAVVHQAAEAPAGGGASDVVADRHIEYMFQLSHAARRFPVNENSIKLSFVWCLSLNNKKKYAMTSMHYERAAIMFNLGTHYAQVACTALADVTPAATGAGGFSQSVSNTALFGALRDACHSLQQAAGVFEELSDYSARYLPSSPAGDLSRHFTGALARLCLAQAHECVARRSVIEEYNSEQSATAGGAADTAPSRRAASAATLVTKLLSTAGALYDEATDCLREAKNAYKDLSPTIQEWITFTSMKALMYHAWAQWRLSVVDRNAERIGPEIARLKVVVEHLNMLNKISKSSPSPSLSSITSLSGLASLSLSGTPSAQSPLGMLTAEAKKLLAMASDRLVSAEKNNNLVYHDPVPENVHKLDEGRDDRISIVRAAQLASVPPTVKPLFEKLVSPLVNEAVLRYTALKNEKINAEAGRLAEATRSMGRTIAELNLSSLLHLNSNSDPSQVIPTALLEQARQIRNSGGAAGLEERWVNLGKMSASCRKILNDALAQLDEEERFSQNLRHMHPTRYTAAPSSALTVRLREEIRDRMSLLDRVAASDKIVRERIDAARPKMHIIGRDEQELLASVPGSRGQRTTDASQSSGISELQALVDQHQHIRATHNSLMQKILDTMDSDDPYPSLADADRASNIDNISPLMAMLETRLDQTYAGLIENINQEIAATARYCESLKDAHSRYTAAAGPLHQTRDPLQVFLQDLEAACSTVSVREDIDSGLQFYSELDPLVRRLASTIGDYVVGRHMEAREMIGHDVPGLPAAGGGSAGGGAPHGQSPYQQPQPQQHQTPATGAPGGGYPQHGHQQPPQQPAPYQSTPYQQQPAQQQQQQQQQPVGPGHYAPAGPGGYPGQQQPAAPQQPYGPPGGGHYGAAPSPYGPPAAGHPYAGAPSPYGAPQPGGPPPSGHYGGGYPGSAGTPGANIPYGAIPHNPYGPPPAQVYPGGGYPNQPNRY